MPRQKGVIYPTPETSEHVKTLWETIDINIGLWMLANDWKVYNSHISFAELCVKMRKKDILVSPWFFDSIRRGRMKNMHVLQFIMVPLFWGYDLDNFLKLGKQLKRKGWTFPTRIDGRINTQGNAGLCGKLAGQTRSQVRKKVFKKRMEEARKVRLSSTL